MVLRQVIQLKVVACWNTAKTSITVCSLDIFSRTQLELCKWGEPAHPFKMFVSHPNLVLMQEIPAQERHIVSGKYQLRTVGVGNLLVEERYEGTNQACWL